MSQMLGAGGVSIPLCLTQSVTAKKASLDDGALMANCRIAASIGDLAKAPTPTQGGSACILLADGERSGIFAWADGDFSKAAAGDRLGGITVAALAGPVTGGAWRRIHDGLIRPEWFGALGDARSDDTDALQAAFDLGLAVSLRPDAVYLVRGVRIPNRRNWQLIMNGATIRAHESAKGGHVLASTNYLDGVGTAQAPIMIQGPGVVDGAKVVDHPLILQSWGSTLGGGTALEVCHGLSHGVVITTHPGGGDQLIKSTLVNNDVHLHSHHNGGSGIWIKDRSRNKATDGTLRGRFNSNGAWGVQIESAAGWDVSVQTYGNKGGVCFDGAGKGFRLHDSYIDDGRSDDQGSLHFAEAINIKTAIGRSLIALSNNFIGRGLVRYTGTERASIHGIKSHGNTYHSGACLAVSGDSAIIYSTSDVFDTTPPCRWIGNAGGTLVVTSGFIGAEGAIVNGKFSALDQLTAAVARSRL